MRVKNDQKYASFVLKNKVENMKDEIILTAVLNCVYAEKVSKEAIQTKVANQLNSIQASISQINPKWSQKSKNYDKMQQQIMDTLSNFEANLIQFCQIRDSEIETFILKKVELETRLLITNIDIENMKIKEQKERSNVINHIVQKINPKSKAQNSTDNISSKIQKRRDLEKRVRKCNQKIKELNEQKVTQVFAAMETENKALSTQIRKTRTIKKIATFFTNRLNTYNTIVKSVIEPINQRIDEFKVNELEKVEFTNQEFNLQEIEEKMKEKQNSLFESREYEEVAEEK